MPHRTTDMRGPRAPGAAPAAPGLCAREGNPPGWAVKKVRAPGSSASRPCAGHGHDHGRGCRIPPLVCAMGRAGRGRSEVHGGGRLRVEIAFQRHAVRVHGDRPDRSANTDSQAAAAAPRAGRSSDRSPVRGFHLRIESWAKSIHVACRGAKRFGSVGLPPVIKSRICVDSIWESYNSSLLNYF